MARYTQLDKSSFGGQNSENEKISLAIDDMLSRKAGDEPNAMETDLDMNSNRILNLPEPVADQEPVRKADFDALEAQLESEVDAAVADANSATNTALNAANTANASAANADEKAAEAEDAILALQVVTIGDFATGFTITARNQVALYDDGVAPTYYRWDGALPKTVSAGSTPATTGGISAGAWVDVGQASLRSDLAQTTGADLIGFQQTGTGVFSGTITDFVNEFPIISGKKVFNSNSTGDALDITNNQTDGGAAIVDIYSKSSNTGTATPNQAVVIHQYRPSSTALQLDHTNTGTMLSMTNAINTNYGPQYGTADFINIYNNDLPNINANWSTNTWKVNRFGYQYYKNWAIHFLDWDDATVSTNGFTVKSNQTWADTSLLQLWQNNSTTVAYVRADGSLFVGSLLIEAVQTPTFENSWVNFGGGNTNAGYWKDKQGMVHLQGMVKSGTINTTIFTLPSEYRPSTNKYFTVNSNNAFGSVIVWSDGRVVPNVGSNVFVSLEGISFRL